MGWRINENCAANNVAFAKMFTYMQSIESRLDEKADKSDIDNLRTTLDGIAEIIGRDDVERAAQNSQLNRVEERVDDLDDLDELRQGHEERIDLLERRAA